MKKIKSFIYLDNQKMYSISSQLFEGLTEYLVKSKSKKYTDEEKQKGNLMSGRLMADIIEEYTNHTEKKFLHDYSYTIFENALINEKKVLSIDRQNISSQIKEINDFHFVKLTGQIVFNDSKMLVETFKNFNQLGESIGYIASQEKNKKVNELEKTVSQIKDRNKRNKAKQLLSSKTNSKKQLLESGLNMDDKFLESLVYVINHMYKSQFEVQIPFPSEIENYLFTSIINRNFLKENEYEVVGKYSRETEKPFTIFGILTQTSRNLNEPTRLEILKNNLELSYDIQGKKKQGNIKEAILNIVPKLTGLEKGFIGRLDYEYIIDPIAIYREL
ncbi:MAG: hypothetical protein R3E32_08220 [Chitinophagales bacterium]